MPTYVRKLRELDEQHQNVILPRYADILPRNTYPAPGWKADEKNAGRGVRHGL